MDAVAGLQRALGKANDDEDWPRMVDVLKQLGEAEVTIETLEELKIGAAVAKHRKHKDTAVADTAKALVKKWKELATAAGVVETGPPKKKKPNGEKPKFTFATEVPAFRDSARQRFIDILAVDAPDARCYELAEQIEVAMAGAFPSHATDATAKKEYVAKLRQLVFNLKKNPSLRDDLRSGSLEPPTLITMSVEDLAPKALQEERQRMREFQQDARTLDWDKQNRDRLMKAIGIDESKGMFQCSKCKSKRVSNHAKQTRSADEPMTQFFECADCGNRWRF